MVIRRRLLGVPAIAVTLGRGERKVQDLRIKS